MSRQALPKEVHQLGDGGLRGDVFSVDYSGIGEPVACIIATGMHASVDTLRDVDNHYALLDGGSDCVVKPLSRGCIAGAIGAEHYAFDARGGELVAQGGFGQTREEVDKHH